MNEPAPKRLLDGPLAAFERAALLADGELTPPPGVQAAVWRRLVAALPPTSTEDSGAKATGSEELAAGLVGSASSRGLGSVIAKYLAFGVGFGIASGWAFGEASRSPAPPAPPAPIAAAPVPAGLVAPPAPTSAPAVIPPVSVTEVVRGPAVAARAHRARRVPPSRPVGADVKEPQPANASRESELVALARSELRQGHAGRCLDILRSLDSDVPSGVLDQERQALAVEALLALGQTQRAQRLLLELEREHPDSPYLERMKALSNREERATRSSRF